MHTTKYPSLQSHSVGELYPWSVTIRGHEETFRCQPQNLITGELGPTFPIPDDEPETFKRACRKAQHWIRNLNLES